MLKNLRGVPLLDRKTLRIGWSVYWRVYFTLAFVQLTGGFINVIAGGNMAAQGAKQLSERFRDGTDIAAVVALPVMLFLFSWASRISLHRRGYSVPAGFIGWSVCWRAILMSTVTAGITCGPIVLIALALAAFHQSWALLPLLILVPPLVIVTHLLSHGWAVLRVHQLSLVASPPVKRPLGIVLVAIFTALLGTAIFFLGIILFFVSESAALISAARIASILIGTLVLAASCGIWWTKRWGFFLGMAIYLTCIPLSLLIFSLGATTFRTILFEATVILSAIGILGYLWTRSRCFSEPRV